MEITRQAEGRRRRRWSRNSRPWLCALYWLGSALCCLFLLYFYSAVWLWSLMNGSICKLHFIWQESLSMSGPGGREFRGMMWSVQKKRKGQYEKMSGLLENSFSGVFLLAWHHMALFYLCLYSPLLLKQKMDRWVDLDQGLDVTTTLSFLRCLSSTSWCVNLPGHPNIIRTHHREDVLNRLH